MCHVRLALSRQSLAAVLRPILVAFCAYGAPPDLPTPSAPLVGLELQPLRGTAIGVLNAGIAPTLAEEGRSAPEGALGFAHKSFGYHLLYIAMLTGGDDLELKVGDGSSSRQFRGLKLATVEDLSRLGLKELPCLVEIEVNEGLGSPGDGAFFASKIRRLDGTPAFPASVPEILRNLERRFRPGPAPPDGPPAKPAADAAPVAAAPQEHTSNFITWNSERQHLEVQFVHRRVSSLVRRAVGIEAVTDDHRANVGTPYGIEKSVVSGNRFEVDRSGKIINSLVNEPRTVIQNLAPPQ